MKYTVLGFNQSEVLSMTTIDTNGSKIRLDITDLTVLRWLVDFSPSMASVAVDGDLYFWVSYSKFVEDMPVLNLKKDSLYRRLKKLTIMGILTHYTKHDRGTYSCYGFGLNFAKLVGDSDTTIPSDSDPNGYGLKSEGVRIKIRGGTDENPRGYGRNTEPKDKSIKNNIDNINNKELKNLKKEKKSEKKEEVVADFIASLDEKWQIVMTSWIDYKVSANANFRTATTFQKAFEKLVRMSGNNPEYASQIVNQSIENAWAGLFPLKSSNQTKEHILKPTSEGCQSVIEKFTKKP